MDVLLEENGRADEIIDAFGDSGEAMEISIGSKVFGVPAFLKGIYPQSVNSGGCFLIHICIDWRVSSMLNVPGDSKTVLICWRPSQDRLDKGVITLYRLNDLNDPYRILICEPEITSCSMSPLHSHIVLAGTMEGSLQAWDLTETTMGEIWPGASEISYHVKRPSYSTDGLYAVEKCHEDYIVSLIPLVNAADKTSGNSFQLASVDALGNVIIWVILSDFTILLNLIN